MITIVVAATKGGVGKSTLAACLAVCAAQNDRATVIDLDPQQSVEFWHARRGRKNRYPFIAKGVSHNDLSERLNEIARSGHKYTIIDTPPAMLDVISAAIYEADFVVIPVKASALDITAINVTVDICQEHDRPFGFVLNDAEPQWKITDSALDALETMGTVLGTVAHREAYVTAMTVGRSGPETADNKKAADAKSEIDTLWAAVLDAARDAVEIEEN